VSSSDLRVDGRIILKNGSSRNEMGRHGLDRTGSGQGQVEGFSECGDELSVSIK